MRNRRILIISLIALLLLGACASSPRQNNVYPMEPGYASPDSQKNTMPEAPAAPAMAEPSADSDLGGTGSTTTIERMVIQNGNLEISVADPAGSMTEIGKLAESLGGYVVSSNTYTGTRYDGATYTSASITIRVPSGRLNETMERVKAMAADGQNGVISENLSGQDVTSDYVDSESRLRNLEAAEKQLQTLLEKTEVVEDTMEIFRELTRIREEIEVTKGHMQYLKESAALSVLTVQLVAEASLKPIEIGGWKPEGVAREAIQELIYMLEAIGSFLIRFGIVCLPILLPVGLVVWLIVRAVAKKRKARKLNPPFKPVVADKVKTTEPKPEQKA